MNLQCEDATSATWMVWPTMRRPVSGLMDECDLRRIPLSHLPRSKQASSGTPTKRIPITVAGAVCECANEGSTHFPFNLRSLKQKRRLQAPCISPFYFRQMVLPAK